MRWWGRFLTFIDTSSNRFCTQRWHCAIGMKKKNRIIQSKRWRIYLLLNCSSLLPVYNNWAGQPWLGHRQLDTISLRSDSKSPSSIADILYVLSVQMIDMRLDRTIYKDGHCKQRWEPMVYFISNPALWRSRRPTKKPKTTSARLSADRCPSIHKRRYVWMCSNDKTDKRAPGTLKPLIAITIGLQ